MFPRGRLGGACVACVMFATACRAEASNQSPQPLWKPVRPPASGDKSNGLANVFERLGRSCHRATFAMRERNNDPFREARDGATSLGVRPTELNALGASAAAIGASVWLFANRRGKTPSVVIGPRLYSGGGGIGVYVRW
jgi:hypothetical protein